MTKFVLRSASKYQGKPLWFHQMTAIGPMTTADPSERAEFSSKEEAVRSPAFAHMLSLWEIEEVSSA